MNIKITRKEALKALEDAKYNPTEATESIELDGAVFYELAKSAHEMDITVNALVNALLHNKLKELGAFDPPSIPGVGTAPYMIDWNS